MPISDLPIFSMLRTEMNGTRNASGCLPKMSPMPTRPSFRPRDLARSISAARCSRRAASFSSQSTSPAHLAGSSDAACAFATARAGKYEIRPAGNAVNLEDEMMKVAANQMDYQAAISLYSRSMGLIRTAIGKR